MTVPSMHKNEGMIENCGADGLGNFSESSKLRENKQTETGNNSVNALVAKSKKAASSLFTLLHAKVRCKKYESRQQKAKYLTIVLFSMK